MPPWGDDTGPHVFFFFFFCGVDAWDEHELNNFVLFLFFFIGGVTAFLRNCLEICSAAAMLCIALRIIMRFASFCRKFSCFCLLSVTNFFAMAATVGSDSFLIHENVFKFVGWPM